MYEVMQITDPAGETYFMGGWCTAEAVESFGDCLEVKHLRAYPKEMTMKLKVPEYVSSCKLFKGSMLEVMINFHGKQVVIGHIKDRLKRFKTSDDETPKEKEINSAIERWLGELT